MKNSTFLMPSLTALALLPGLAFAIGLGPLEVESRLGSPLRARITLSKSSWEEVTPGCLIQVAPVQGGSVDVVLPPSDLQAQLQVENGGSILLTTRRRINEPFIDLSLELDCGERGRMRREYTLLLDPPLPEPAVPEVRAVATPTPNETPAPASQAGSERNSRESTPSAVIESEVAGSVWVRPGDTLSAIAIRYVDGDARARGVFIRSIVAANPRVFPDGDPDLLPAGVELRIPVADAMAKNEVAPASTPIPPPVPAEAVKSDPPEYRLELARAPDNRAPGGPAQALQRTADELLINTELDLAEREALKTRIAELEAQLQRLTQTLQRIGPMSPPPPSASMTPSRQGPIEVAAATPAAPETPTETRPWWLLAVLVLFGGGLAWWLRRRSELVADGEDDELLVMARPEVEAPPQSAPREEAVQTLLDEVFPLKQAEVEQVQPPDPFAPEEEEEGNNKTAELTAELEGFEGPGRTRDSLILEDLPIREKSAAHHPEINNLLVKAEFYLLLKQPENAIRLLKENITAGGEMEREPSLWLMLLRIYRQEGIRETFLEQEHEFRSQFNIAIPGWDDWQEESRSDQGLEQRFPRLLQAIISLWNTSRCAEFIDGLLLDDRGGVRQGFNLGVAEDLLMLKGLLRLRG